MPKFEYREEALRALTERGFTLRDRDEARKYICKIMPVEMNRYKEKFIQAGGSEAEWDEIVQTLRTKPTLCHVIAMQGCPEPKVGSVPWYLMKIGQLLRKA